MRDPLQDFVAFFAADPAERRVALERLRRGAAWRDVSMNGDGWVTARRPLLASEPLAPDVGGGLVFAEGQRRLLPSGDENGSRDLSEVIDQRPWRLDTLPGDFTFVRLRPHGCATAVRSAAGRAPIYYHASPTRTIVTTRFGSLSDLAPAHLRLDPLANASIVGVVPAFPHGRGLLRDTFVLGAGNYAELRPEGVRTTSYWDPLRRFVPLPSERARAEHIEHLRDLLLSYLERELDPSGANLLLLSGGVDSSILAVLSRHELRKRIMSLSLVPPEGHPARAREMSFIEPLVRKLGIDHSWYFGVDMRRLDATLLAAPDTGFHFLHYMLAMVPDLQRERSIRVVFGGEFADDLLGGPQRLPEWASHAPISTLLRIKNLPVGKRDWARWAKHRAWSALGAPLVTVPPPLSRVIAPAVRAEHAAWTSGARSRLRQDRRPLRQLAALLEHKDWIIGYWEAAAAVGVRRALPFVHREIIELAAQLHPVELFGPGTKSSLKAAARESPPRFVARSEKGHWIEEGDPNPLLPWGIRPPEQLSGIIHPSLFERPPAFLRLSERSLVQQLVLFAERLQRRRALADLRSVDLD